MAEIEYSAHQRAAVITQRLLGGQRLSTATVARVTGLTPRGALYLMYNLSGVLPLVVSHGVWRLFDLETDPASDAE